MNALYLPECVSASKKVMKSLIVFIILASAFRDLDSQQCRQVTVCDEDVASTRKGEKGDTGIRGKAGPMGMKGNQGESCDSTVLESEMRKRFSDLESLLTPASCLTSSLYGRQILRSGEEVFCDNGWTIFQKRFNKSVNFDRNWNDYTVGFGDINGNFWLGLEKIHALTFNKGCKLRVDLWNNDNGHEFAIYSDFHVEGESDNYRLHVAGYHGTAGDGLTEHHDNDGIHDRQQFTTKDRDNDLRTNGNCAGIYDSGWWHNNCYESNLNRPLGRGRALKWDQNESIKSSVMKLRCD